MLGPFSYSGNIPLSVAEGGTGATSFTTGSVIFMGATALSQDNANFFWDNANDYLGVGTNTPDAEGHFYFDNTIGPLAGPTTNVATESDNPSNFIATDTVQYKVYARFPNFVSNTSATSNTVTIANTNDDVNVECDAVSGAISYIWFRNKNGAGFVEAYEPAGSSITLNDTDGIVFTWGAVIAVTPTTFSGPVNTRINYPTTVGSLFGLYAGAPAYITTPTDCFDVALDVYQPNTRSTTGTHAIGFRIIKSVAGSDLPGSGSLANNISHFVLENPNEDAQTLFTFSKGGSPTGGVRGDAPGNFNWQALGYHAFYNALDPTNCGVFIQGGKVNLAPQSPAGVDGYSYVQIHAGDTDFAPLLVPTGVRKTSPVAGCFEFESNWHLTNSSVLRYTLGGVIFDHYVNAGNTTTTETDLYSDSLAGSTMSVAGDKVEANYDGIFVSSATATRRVRVYFAGTLIYDSTALGVTTSADWALIVRIIRVDSATVRCGVSANTTTASAAPYCKYTEVGGLDLTAANILKITGTAAGVGAATNDIVAKFGRVIFKGAA